MHLRDALPIAPPGYRPYQLDGALLYFEPRSGTHVRVENRSSKHMRRQAPRVVMFGITNLCNLRCSFCSRDITSSSLWTVNSSAEVLSDLAKAGVLEVAFGGGEPLAFSGFDELVTRLRSTTALATHVTTNGKLVTHERWRQFDGAIGIARLSVYDDTDLVRISSVWNDLGQRWGANVLVDDAALPQLPTLLAELATLRSHDVSILTYVGEPSRLLSSEGRRKLASIIKDAPLPCRLSVCAGSTIHVPRLFSGLDHSNDCGAGRDFVTVTSDQRLQACSFAPQGLPARTASEILAGWRLQQARLSEPSPRSGCARHDSPTLSCPIPPLAIWQSFAGNNSGECTMVARFEERVQAESFLAELLPGWQSDEPWSEQWIELVRAAGVAVPAFDSTGRTQVDAPRELEIIGRSVIAITYGLGDEMYPLRHLAWRKQAHWVDGPNHAHGNLVVLAIVRCRDADDVAQIRQQLVGHEAVQTWPRGGDLIVMQTLIGDVSLQHCKQKFAALFGERDMVVEVLEAPHTDELTHAISRYHQSPPRVVRLHTNFWDYDADADRLKGWLKDHPSTWYTKSQVMVEHVSRPRRLAVLAARANGTTYFTYGDAINVHGYVFTVDPPRVMSNKATGKGKSKRPTPVDVAALKAALSGSVYCQKLNVSIDRYRTGVSVTGSSAQPGELMQELEALARRMGLEMNIGFSDDSPLVWTLRILFEELQM